MKESVEVLFKLLRIALGNESDYSLPSSVNWKEVIDLSFEQGVAALAVDGLQKIYDEIADQVRNDALEELDSPPLEDLKYEWFGEVMNCEQEYASQWASACEMANLYKKNGIRMVVVKGFSVAQYYPVPSHRSCGDLDCFLMGNYEKGNALIEAAGIEVERELYKHSKFVYKGLVVENHQFCTAVRGSKKAKRLERYLQDIIAYDSPKYIGDSALESSNPMFSALFLTIHALRHFLSEGLSLRHICDWAVLIRSEEAAIDWKVFDEKCREFGLLRFAQSMTRLAYKVCGVRVGWMPEVDLQDSDVRLLNEIITRGDVEHISGNAWKQRWIQIKNIAGCGWKYRLFGDRSALGDLWVLITGFLFDRKPSLS